eukprot:GEMP01039393.1.p1 GENE.GEMP01039393.1~~GEMP01039393.1.p1  ORF type:complete len:402 (+),score=87.36 GEMP01039393.1:273-1478(+)
MLNMDDDSADLPSFEYGLLRTPWEIGFKSLRGAQKAVEKELPAAISFLVGMKLKTSSSREECLSRMGKLEDKVAQLLKDVRQAKDDHLHQFGKCTKRLKELNEDSKQVAKIKKAFAWNLNQPFGADSTYVSRLLADYLASSGYIRSARAIIEREKLEDLVDLEVYEELAFHLDHLQEGNVKSALEWCVKYRTTLKKKKSTLEATLHLQQYLKLVEEKKYAEGVQYLRQYVTPKDLEKCKDFSRAMALPAFLAPPNDEYTHLVGTERRDELRALFCENFRMIYGLPTRPLFEVLMEVGFIALLSPVCSEGTCVSCPCCDPLWRPVLDRLPMCHKTRSVLLDPISGDVMDEEKNPPMAAPSGVVYGQQQVAKMERVDDESEMVVCPTTNQRMKLSEFQRVYVT